MIHGAAGALGSPRGVEFSDDFIDRAGVRWHGKRDVSVAQRAVALAAPREIERDDRDAFTPGVGPDVGLGPVQDRMDAQMRAGGKTRIEVIPEFRRLVAHLPMALKAAGRKHTFLGAGRLFVAANAGNQAIKAMLGQRTFQALGLAGSRTSGWRQAGIDSVNRR